MKEQTRSAIELLEALTERAKELRCLYAIEEALKDPDADIDEVCNRTHYKADYSIIFQLQARTLSSKTPFSIS